MSGALASLRCVWRYPFRRLCAAEHSSLTAPFLAGIAVPTACSPPCPMLSRHAETSAGSRKHTVRLPFPPPCTPWLPAPPPATCGAGDAQKGHRSFKRRESGYNQASQAAGHAHHERPPQPLDFQLGRGPGGDPARGWEPSEPPGGGLGANEMP